ncbi:MAG: DUF6913 domain-containing protein, partial [Chitinophagaceae bacterium]
LSESAHRSSHFKKDKKNHFGILVNAGIPEDRNIIIHFADQLRKDGHRVKILGFLEGRAEGIAMPFDFFTSAELAKISNVPRSPVVDSFLEQPFDVLINTSIHINYKALDYISSLSKATFRIGPWYPHQRHNPYDLCLDTGSSATLKEWINELMHTLQKIY